MGRAAISSATTGRARPVAATFADRPTVLWGSPIEARLRRLGGRFGGRRLRRRVRARPGRAITAMVLAVSLGGAALVATPAPAGAIQLGWNKSSAPQMAKVAAAAKAAEAKKEKAEAAAAAAARAEAALEAEQAAEAVRLLDTLGSEQRQFWSLDAYDAAQDYVRRAEAGSRAAAGAVGDAISVWDTSKLDVLKALTTVTKARATVQEYKRALGELGLAVYTGAADTDLNYIGSKETQLAEADLAGVAAAETSTGLHRSERGLAQSIVNVGIARATVRTDWGKVLQAKEAQTAAIAQVALSRRDVSAAKVWATVPGEAPLQPVESLALLEGALAPRTKPGGHSSGGSGVLMPTVTPMTALASTTEAAQASKAPADPPASLAAMAGYGPGILGPPLLSAAQVAGWFASTGYHARVTVPFGQLVDDYFKAGQLTGVRADIAFAQSVIETGYFSFPAYGQDAPGYNNFAGIGACDNCQHGWRFPSAMTGVLSQEELLEVYATPPHLTAEYGKPNSDFGIAGCCSTWMSLAGTWASAGTYGYDILNIYNQMVAWALPRDLRSAGLLSASAAGKAGAAAASRAGSTPTSRPGKSSLAPSRTPQT